MRRLPSPGGLSVRVLVRSPVDPPHRVAAGNPPLDRDDSRPMVGASSKFHLPHTARCCLTRMPGGAITGMRPGDDFDATAHVNHDSSNFRKSRITFLNFYSDNAIACFAVATFRSSPEAEFFACANIDLDA